jgi:hypothetical protein
MSTIPGLQLPRISKHKMAALTNKAKSLGMTPQRYIELLIEQDLALDHRAKTTSFADLTGPGRPIDETEIHRLVDQARTRHHQRTTRAKK